MNILIFGGTTEGRELSHLLTAMGDRVTVCVATDYGREAEGEAAGMTVLTGRKTAEEKAELLRDAEVCVDATHPYAASIGESVRAACEAARVPYLRLARRGGGAYRGLTVDSAAEAADYLRGRPGTVLLTTGVKELPAFAALDPARLAVRVLPTAESISACRERGIPSRNIVAMQGPFSREMNAALLRHYDAKWLVTKDGGLAGGFPEKAQAASDCGAGLIVLRRPERAGEDAGENLHGILWKIEEMKRCK